MTSPQFRLRTDDTDEAERHATWLELFYDLIYVAAIAQLAALLLQDHSLGGILRAAGVFVIIWWAWTGHTMFSDRFDNDDTIERLLTFGQMACVLAMSVAIPHLFDAAPNNAPLWFGLGYVVLRALMWLAYLRVYRGLKTGRGVPLYFLRMIGVGTLLFAIGTLLPSPLRFWIWGIALVGEMAVPWVWRRPLAGAGVNSYHLPERLGLFVIIVLGESVVAAMNGISEIHHWNFSTIVATLCGLGVVGLLWWLYFDYVSTLVHGTLAPKGENRFYGLYLYGHAPLFFGIILLAIGIEEIILHGKGQIATASGLILFLVTLNILRFRLHLIQDLKRYLVPTTLYCVGLLVLVATGLPSWLMLLVTVLAFGRYVATERVNCECLREK